MIAGAQTPAFGILQVAAANGHTCAIVANTTGGVVKCWGDNVYGELGDGTTINRITPVDVSGLPSGITKIELGDSHACALTSTGGVKCWGDNRHGQLGDGTVIQRNTPVDVIGLSAGVVAISAGGAFTCAVMGNSASGSAKCWGDNSSGELGDGTNTDRSLPVDVNTLTSGVVSISAGAYFTCALTFRSGAKCWGNNINGQLGDGTRISSSIPVGVSGLANGVLEISAATSHACALVTNISGSAGVKCWGDNVVGQLGDNTMLPRGIPADVFGLTTGVTKIASGTYHTCAIVVNGTGGGMVCWGINFFGALGDATTNNRNVPTAVSGLASGAAAISAGGESTCAILASSASDGGLKCWGHNTLGELGDGTTISRSIPANVIALRNHVTAISGGVFHTCTLFGSGVKCWGQNLFGQLGDGGGNDRTAYGDVSGLATGVLAVASGERHTCAMVSSGNGVGARCWGNNSAGQIGDGTALIRFTPVNVSGLSTGVISLSSGHLHVCAVVANGVGGAGAKCWGTNLDGQLGDGTINTTRNTPTDVVGLGTGIAAVAAGGAHTCALTVSGGVKCWGANTFGQLGDNTITKRATPVDVVGLGSGVAAIAAGGDFNCALVGVTAAGGGVMCWGANIEGVLGDGTTTPRNTPATVPGLSTGVVAISAGINHLCALVTSGGIKCLGQNTFGQLGDGTFTQRRLPVDVISLGSNVAMLAAGGQHTCAIIDSSTASESFKCWGANSEGQLGEGSTANRSLPVDILAFTPLLLTSSSNSVPAAQSVTFTAQMAGSFPTGTVTFKDGGVDIVGCVSVALLITRSASCTTAFSTFGPRTITATYSGDSYNAPSINALEGGQVVMPIPVPFMLAIVSRKSHGGRVFDLPISGGSANIVGVPVEPRAIGNGHTIAFQFDGSITVAGSVTAIDSVGATVGAAAVPAGNEVLVTLTSIPDNSRVTISLVGVNGAVDASVSMGFLVGDVNNSRSVNSSDISNVKARSGQTADASNFKSDLNASGTINSSDISAVKARSGLTLP